MISMNFALMFLFSSIISCVFFSLGRVVGRIDAEQTKKTKAKVDKEIRVDLSSIKLDNYTDKYEPQTSSSSVIDAEYEDVVFDLQKYKDKKNIERENEINAIANYEIMFSKRDRRFVKMPKEIAELIRQLKNEI